MLFLEIRLLLLFYIHLILLLFDSVRKAFLILSLSLCVFFDALCIFIKLGLKLLTFLLTLSYQFLVLCYVFFKIIENQNWFLYCLQPGLMKKVLKFFDTRSHKGAKILRKGNKGQGQDQDRHAEHPARVLWRRHWQSDWQFGHRRRR